MTASNDLERERLLEAWKRAAPDFSDVVTLAVQAGRIPNGKIFCPSFYTKIAKSQFACLIAYKGVSAEEAEARIRAHYGEGRPLERVLAGKRVDIRKVPRPPALELAAE